MNHAEQPPKPRQPADKMDSTPSRSGANPPGVSKIITPSLLQALKAEYRLDWDGIHGIRHWRRVREFGLHLAVRNGANLKVVEYFAFLHDSQRQSDGHDPDHGRRACAAVRARFADMLDLTPEEVDLLCDACDRHNEGFTQADLTVQTCWDADRLDLMRVGIRPNPQHLCTPEAKDASTIAWAIRRSTGLSLP